VRAPTTLRHRWVVLGHRGRWVPSCAGCNWTDVTTKTRAEAEALAKAHEREASTPTRATRRKPCRQTVGVNREHGFSNLTPLELDTCGGEVVRLGEFLPGIDLMMCERCGAVTVEPPKNWHRTHNGWETEDGTEGALLS